MVTEDVCEHLASTLIVMDGPLAFKYGIPVPQRLIRIDYVFVSEEWRLGSIQIAEYYGGGDHLGLFVELALPED